MLRVLGGITCNQHGRYELWRHCEGNVIHPTLFYLQTPVLGYHVGAWIFPMVPRTGDGRSLAFRL